MFLISIIVIFACYNRSQKQYFRKKVILITIIKYETFDYNTMTQKQYQKPEMDSVSVHFEGALLSGSILMTLGALEANESTGENITYTSPVDPW